MRRSSRGVRAILKKPVICSFVKTVPAHLLFYLKMVSPKKHLAMLKPEPDLELKRSSAKQARNPESVHLSALVSPLRTLGQDGKLSHGCAGDACAAMRKV